MATDLTTWPVRALDYAAAILAELCSSPETFADYWSFAKNAGYGWEQAQDKLISEAALLVLLAERAGASGASARAILEAMHAYSLAGRNLPLVMNHPQTVSGLSLVPAVLRLSGFPPTAYAKAVTAAATAQSNCASERLPFREMDRRWTAALLTGAEADYRDLMGQSILRGVLHPAELTRADAYAFTHSVMYLTDFGRTLPDYVDTARIALVIDAYICRYIAEFDLDLLAEMLLVSRCVGTEDSPHYALGVALVGDVWDSQGVVPGPSFDPAAFERHEGQRGRWYAIAECYHTTFVAGIFAAIDLSVERTDRMRDGSENLLRGRIARLGKRLATLCAEAQPSLLPEPETALARLGDRLSQRCRAHIADTAANRLTVDVALAKTMVLGDWAALAECVSDAIATATDVSYPLVAAIELLLDRAELAGFDQALGDGWGVPRDMASVEGDLARWTQYLETQLEIGRVGLVPDAPSGHVASLLPSGNDRPGMPPGGVTGAAL